MLGKKYIAIGIILISILGFGIYYLSQEDENVLTLATTTSVENSGLLDMLISEFEKSYDIVVKVTAKGSGAAVDLAKRGEADAVLIHAPDLEAEFMTEGFGLSKTTLWFNYFIIVGPSDDPANISEAETVEEAFSRLKTAGDIGEIEFFSRGDNSGTNLKELAIWDSSNISLSSTDESWYFETGSGMSATLLVADEKNAYTLSDLGTYLQIKENSGLQLNVLYDGEEALYNPYSYIIVSPDKFDNLNTNAATTFLEFLEEENTIELVNNYKVADTVLFTPIP